MMDFKKMYFSLFNALSDVLVDIEKVDDKSNYAVFALKKVQYDFEERYLDEYAPSIKPISIDEKREIKDRVG